MSQKHQVLIEEKAKGDRRADSRIARVEGLEIDPRAFPFSCNTTYTHGQIEGCSVGFCVDSGSQMSLISEADVKRQDLKPLEAVTAISVQA